MSDALKPPTERIPLQSWVRTPKIVRAEFTALLQELAEVKQRLEKAQEQLRRDSQNSSQPPSQDKPGHEPVRADDPGRKKRVWSKKLIWKGMALSYPAAAVKESTVHLATGDNAGSC
jgi:hypothetical protein